MSRTFLILFLLADLAFISWWGLSPGTSTVVDAEATVNSGPSVGRIISSLAVPIVIVAIVLYFIPDETEDDPSSSND